MFDLARNFAPHLTPEDRDILSSNIKVLSDWSADEETALDGEKTEESSAGEVIFTTLDKCCLM